MPQHAKFLAALRDLRKKVPTAFPVQVRRKDIPASECCFGTCTFDGNIFKITIDKSISNDMAVETLIHEWAHVIAWTHEHDTVDDHGPEWGLAYSRVFRAFFEVE